MTAACEPSGTGISAAVKSRIVRSALTIRPAGLNPFTATSSTPCSWARRRASGLDLMRSLRPDCVDCERIMPVGFGPPRLVCEPLDVVAPIFDLPVLVAAELQRNSAGRFALLNLQCQRSSHFDGFGTCRHDQLADGARIHRLKLYHHLVCLYFSKEIAWLDRVAFLHQPLL